MKLQMPASPSLVLSVGVLVALQACGVTAGSSFLQPGPVQISAGEAEMDLFSEMSGNVSAARLAKLEEQLLPTYTALPKGEEGHLSHQTVRYVLHRLFVQKYSWFMRGLEPNDDAPPPYLQGEWVPSYLQGLLEQRFGEKGIDLRELAALAATLEDLVFKESSTWLEMVYAMLRLETSQRLNSKEVRGVVSTYMMIYLRGGNYSALIPEEVEPEMLYFASQYTDWPVVLNFMRKVQSPYVNASKDGKLDFQEVARVVDEVAKEFGTLNDRECRNLKATMMNIEDTGRSGQPSGRVRLSDFYRKGLYSHWEFNEKIGYLRTLGALDESDKASPQVLIPNYVGSRTNCLQSSSLYLVCCRNECEDLMSHLEVQIASPMAEPRRIADLVRGLASDTIEAPRNLSESLLSRLGDIAESHGGKVPLHGRLFAQWMHHAYPRECPFPHESGTTSPLTPDEWMSETGEANSKATEEEMHWHIGNDTCSKHAPVGSPCRVSSLVEEEADSELPWSHVEELLAVKPASLGASAESGLIDLLELPRSFLAIGALVVVIWYMIWYRSMLNQREAKSGSRSVPPLCLSA